MDNKKIIKHILNATPKKYTFWNTDIGFKLFGIFFLLILLIFLTGCSSTPIVDSRGKSSANIKGDMNRYHDDYFTCKSLVEKETNYVLDAGKNIYNMLRWRALWLSPKLNTRSDYLNNCLEGRGYNVINK